MPGHQSGMWPWSSKHKDIFENTMIFSKRQGHFTKHNIKKKRHFPKYNHITQKHKNILQNKIIIPKTQTHFTKKLLHFSKHSHISQKTHTHTHATNFFFTKPNHILQNTTFISQHISQHKHKFLFCEMWLCFGKSHVLWNVVVLFVLKGHVSLHWC